MLAVANTVRVTTTVFSGPHPSNGSDSVGVGKVKVPDKFGLPGFSATELVDSLSLPGFFLGPGAAATASLSPFYDVSYEMAVPQKVLRLSLSKTTCWPLKLTMLTLALVLIPKSLTDELWMSIMLSWQLLASTVLAVVVEEAVHASAVDERVAGVHHTDTPGTSAGGRSALGKVRVSILGVEGERNSGVRVALHVGGFSLEDAAVNILSTVEVVVVELVVFGSGAPEPSTLGALQQKTTAVVDVDLVVIREVKLVISDPEPSVLHVDASRRGDVQKHESAKAS